MKQILILFIALLAMSACDSKVERPAPALSQDRIIQQNQQASAPSAIASTGNIQHYYCPDKCEGSGGDNAGNCPVCGKEYVHNQAWHDAQVVQQTQQPMPEPPQNAAGVWHYTCPKGCAGGAGSAVACSQCGSTLAHNQAYHN